MAADLSDEAAVVGAVRAVAEHFGRLDVLHNNAALTDSDFLDRDTPVTELDARRVGAHPGGQPDAVRCSPASTPSPRWSGTEAAPSSTCPRERR